MSCCVGRDEIDDVEELLDRGCVGMCGSASGDEMADWTGSCRMGYDCVGVTIPVVVRGNDGPFVSPSLSIALRAGRLSRFLNAWFAMNEPFVGINEPALSPRSTIHTSIHRDLH